MELLHRKRHQKGLRPSFLAMRKLQGLSTCWRWHMQGRHTFRRTSLLSLKSFSAMALHNGAYLSEET